jgi:predicted nucleic acid-binding protein
MYKETIENELIKPANLDDILLESGLKSIDVSIEEYMLAEQYNARYRKPSIHDCMALAVAKERNITLLTGDGALRKAAEAEGVSVIGTIGILDQLLEEDFIDIKEYRECLESFEELNGGIVRLPKSAIKERLYKTK